MPFGGIFNKKSEEDRLEVVVQEFFRSSHEAEGGKGGQKLARWAAIRPLETVTTLLRHYHDEDENVRRIVKRTLSELAEDKACEEAVLVDMVHPSRVIRKSVQSYLGDTVGAHAVTYASFYEQTMLLVAMSKRNKIPVEDIVSLAERTKRTFMEGDVMDAVMDIGLCLDLLKHRYRSSEQLKDYLAELLRMAPDSSRMGVYGGTIEEPLRKAMMANRQRRFDDTSEVIEERNMESNLRRDLLGVANEVRSMIRALPQIKEQDLYVEDKLEVSKLRDLVDSITSLVLANERREAKLVLQENLGDFIQYYQGPLKERVKDQDPGALFILYNAGLVFVKLASSLISVTAEEIYQTGFRQLEGEPSIHVVMWPEVVMGSVPSDVGQGSDIL